MLKEYTIKLKSNDIPIARTSGYYYSNFKNDIASGIVIHHDKEGKLTTVYPDEYCYIQRIFKDEEPSE